MNCKNCNAELSSTAKFCTVCGTPVEQPKVSGTVCRSCGAVLAEGIKFCTTCGTAVEVPASQPVIPVPPMPVAPVAPAAAPQPVAPVVPAAPVAPAAAPQPVAPVVSAAVPQPVNDVMPEVVPQPVNDVMPASQPMDDSAPKPSDFGMANAFNQAPPAYTPPSVNNIDMDIAGIDMSAASAAVVKPVKKNKMGLWIALGVVGVIAAVAVVCGVFFRGVVANLFMGDNKYAAMVEGNAIKSVTENELYKEAVAEYIDAFSTSMASAAAAANADYTTSGGTTVMSGIDLNGLIDTYNQTFMDTYGTDGATANLAFDIELSEAGKNALGFDSSFDEVIEIVNESQFEISFQAGEDALGLEIAATDAEKFTVNAQGVVFSDGTVAVKLPFATDKALKMTLDSEGNVTSAEEVDFDIDSAEVERISTEIISIYLKYIELAEVTIEKDSLKAAKVEAEGRLITIVIDSDLFAEMTAEIINFLADDEYFTDKACELAELMGEEYTEADLKSDMKDSVDELKDGTEFEITIKTLVDNNGRILAKGVGMDIKDDGEAEMTFVSGDAEQGFELEADGGSLTVRITEESLTDGKIRVDFEDADNKFGLNIDYEGVKTEKYLDKNDVVVGKFTAYYAGTEDSEENGSAVTVELETSVDGDKLINVISADVSEYGKFKLTMAVTPENLDLTELPSDAVDFTNTDSWTDDENKANAQYLLDACNEIKTICESDSDSTFASLIAPLAAQGVAYFEDILTPMVDSETLSALANRVSQFQTTLDDTYSANSDYVSNELLNECSDAYDELDDIYYDVAYEYEMEQDEYNEILADVDSLETTVNDLCNRIKQEAEDAKSQQAAHGGDLIGMWSAATISGFGETMTAEEVEFTMYIFFYDDGSYLWSWDGEVTTGTWTLENGIVTLVEEDWYYEFNYENGQLYYLADADITIFLAKQ